jgi:hypothetical protein
MALARGQTIFADNLLDRAMEGRRWNATAGENNTSKPWRDWFVLFAFATAFRDRGRASGTCAAGAPVSDAPRLSLKSSINAMLSATSAETDVYRTETIFSERKC